ncbi:MAG: dihydroneopterin aldolase [Porphyromonadaceae bacterium]|nr:MAG: dihydroneopterin aldolase [Porphyromonadaceae bacterium]
MNAITLHKMKFFAYHGVGEQERVVGNHFEVTLKVYCPMEKAMTDDDLNGTVNYADLYATVEAEMARPIVAILEKCGLPHHASRKKEFPHRHRRRNHNQ